MKFLKVLTRLKYLEIYFSRRNLCTVGQKLIPPLFAKMLNLSKKFLGLFAEYELHRRSQKVEYVLHISINGK